MKISIHPKRRTAPPQAASASKTPGRQVSQGEDMERFSRDSTAINLRIECLRIEGCGPISPHALREGFRSVMLAEGSSLQPADDLKDAFAEPIDLPLSHHQDPRETGRAIARSILDRIRNGRIPRPSHPAIIHSQT
jgi:hypothetical protein